MRLKSCAESSADMLRFASSTSASTLSFIPAESCIAVSRSPRNSSTRTARALRSPRISSICWRRLPDAVCSEPRRSSRPREYSFLSWLNSTASCMRDVARSARFSSTSARARSALARSSTFRMANFKLSFSARSTSSCDAAPSA